MDPVIHFEMPYEDRDRVAVFYESVFGWKTQKFGEEMGNYLLVTTAETDANPTAQRGAISGGFFPKGPNAPTQPSVVIGVADIAASMRKVTEAGGQVLGEPVMIPGIGQFVHFLDTEGNRASILQPSET